MIVYEVNLSVDVTIIDEFREWLDHHVREMLTFEGFESAEVFQVDSASSDRVELCTQYRLRDRKTVEDYMENHASRMRADGMNRFPDRFQASRRIMSA